MPEDPEQIGVKERSQDCVEPRGMIEGRATMLLAWTDVSACDWEDSTAEGLLYCHWASLLGHFKWLC